MCTKIVRFLSLSGCIMLSACTPDYGYLTNNATHTIGGTVVGLRGAGLMLQNNGGDNLAIGSDGNFAFSTALSRGASYTVTVLAQPGSPEQTCAVSSGSGTVMSAAITSVQISCVTNTYLFYRNPLSAVDPANPANPILIEPPGTIGNVTAIEHATYRAAPLYLLVDRHYNTIVYRKSASGTLWKLSALKDGNLAPAQMSNETTATAAFCGTWAEPDYADIDNAQFIYRLPGTDGTCGNADDFWKMVKVGMSAVDTPYPAFLPLAALHDTASGAINGWLAVNGSNLNAYDANFENPSLISAFTSTPTVLATSPAGHVVLLIDNELRVYDPQAAPPALSASLGTVTSVGTARRDTTHVYFDDGSALYKLPLDGSTMASLVHTGSGSVSLHALTDNRLVYWDDSSVKSVPKSGGNAVTFAIASGAAIESIGASGTKYYFHSYYFSGSWRSTAHIIDEDGTNDVTIPDAAWFGWTEPTTISFGSGPRNLPMDRVLLRNVPTAPYTLTSYIGASGAPQAVMGTLPATMDQSFSPFFMRLPNHGNLLGYSSASDSGTDDIVFVNTEFGNSLMRVTSSSSSNEIPVGARGCSISSRAEFDPTLVLILLAAIVCLRRRTRRCVLVKSRN